MDQDPADQLPRSFRRAFIRILASRRATSSLLAIICLTILGIVNKIDTSMAIATVAGAMAAANAYQKKP